MPTGYIADVQSGKVTTLREFVLRCARAFGACILQRGACILQRDDSLDRAPEMQEPSDYSAKALRKARSLLRELEALTPAGAKARASQAFDKALRQHQEAVSRNATEQKRYRDMLAKVEEWEPPTPDHVNLKAFMREQLTGSLDFDNFTLPAPKRLNGAAWKAQELARCRRDIAYHEKADREERERTAERNRWIQQLYEGLPTV
jgi:hypothetical protein